MKIVVSLLLLSSFAAHAYSPILSVKERVRLHLWVYGLEDQPVKKKVQAKVLPEELERALKKI